MMRRLDWDPYLEWDKDRYPSERFHALYSMPRGYSPGH